MRTLRLVHRWLGLALVIPLMVQGSTGLLLVLLPLTTTPRPQVAASEGQTVPASRLVSAARTAAPSGLAPLHFAPARWDGDTVEIGFGQPGSRVATFDVLVDPGSARVITQHGGDVTFSIVRRLHTALLLPMPFGRSVIGWIGIGFFVLSASGLAMWWPRPVQWRSGAWRRNMGISRRARGRRLWREAHLALGGWTAAMMLVMSGTGIVLGFPETTRALLGVSHTLDGSRPGRRAQQSSPGAAQPLHEEDGLDAALSRVRSDLPGVVVMDAVLGVSPAPLRLRVTIPELGPDQPLQVLADRHGRSIVVLRDPRRQGGIERALAWMQFLHEAKLPARHWIRNSWSAIVGAAGLSLALFATTGAAMWLLRHRSRKGGAFRINSSRPVQPVARGAQQASE